MRELPGLTEYLASTWGIPVEIARPFDRIDAGRYADEVAAAGASLAVAVGLALRHPGDKRVIRINLAPPTHTQERAASSSGCRR